MHRLPPDARLRIRDPMLLALIVLLTVTARLTGGALAHAVLYLWSGLLLVTLLLVLGAAAGIRAAYDVGAERCEAGESLPVRLQVWNRSLLPATAVLLTDRASLLPILPEDQPVVCNLLARRSIELGPFSIRPRRGIWQLGPVDVEVRDPLGIWRVIIRESISSQLIVYPSAPRVRSFRLPVDGGGRRGFGGSHATQSTASNDVRTWRPGDDPRHIHWKISARREELYTRTFDLAAAGEVMVCLDTHLGDGDPAVFDRLVTCTAALGRAALAQGYAVGLAYDGVVALPAERDRAQLPRLLDCLARVTEHSGGDGDLETLLAARTQVRSGAAVVLLTLVPRPKVLNAFASLRSSGLRPVVIRLVPASQGVGPEPALIPIYRITRPADLEGVGWG